MYDVLCKVYSVKCTVQLFLYCVQYSVRSVCEQSSSVWHSGLTQQNEEDLERIQKVALKIILKEKYKDYQTGLNILDLQNLKDRRKYLCLDFARKCLKNEKMKYLFPPNNKIHDMETRDSEHFKVSNFNTERMRNSPIIYMQNLLNNEVRRKKTESNIWKD